MAAQMLDELLRAAAERTPLAPAVSAADGELSYRELHELASRIGAGLRELGVRPGDRVGLLEGKPPPRWRACMVCSTPAAGTSRSTPPRRRPAGLG